jgi:hypothetical protein
VETEDRSVSSIPHNCQYKSYLMNLCLDFVMTQGMYCKNYAKDDIHAKRCT